jgi:hypothetical protein
MITQRYVIKKKSGDSLNEIDTIMKQYHIT